jgi:hypothetical protein
MSPKPLPLGQTEFLRRGIKEPSQEVDVNRTREKNESKLVSRRVNFLKREGRERLPLFF